LLVASREDIDVSSEWNRHLLAAIPQVFLEAVYILNRGELRYLWIRYLAAQSPLPKLYRNVASNIAHRLSQARVVESQLGELEVPNKLRYLQTEFRDHNQKPFIQSSHTTASNLSEKYSPSDHEALELLGVRPLSPTEFVADLGLYISTTSGATAFRRMTATWHSSLAFTLLRIIHREPQLRDQLTLLPIVPLRNGEWVATSDQQTYFASLLDDFKIPHDTLAGEIEPSAITHLPRLNLFQTLGARPFTRELICQSIVQKAQAFDIDSTNVQLCDHLARVMFLFTSRWKNHAKHDLWVVTEDGSVQRSSKVYMQSANPYSAMEVLAGKSTSFKFLHPCYTVTPAPSSRAWRIWLVEELRVAEIPRLVISLLPKLVIATDFKVLAKEDPKQLLLVLREHWQSYVELFLPSRSQDRSYDDAKVILRAKLAAILVPCIGGHMKPLGLTTLPAVKTLLMGVEVGNFLDLIEPEDYRWNFLINFGVIVRPGVEQFVRYLKEVKKTPCSVQKISAVYRQLSYLAAEYADDVK
jgi:hypothetical protein